MKIEKEVELKSRKKAVNEWETKKVSGEITIDENVDDNIYLLSTTVSDNEMADKPFVSHVPVPSQKDVEDILVIRKKQELLDRYASEILRAQSSEAKTLMGV